MKYQIQYKKKKEKYGFIGMNKYAAKSHHIPFNHKHPAHVLEIYKKVPHNVRTHTIRHEEMEEYLMKNKHYRYPKAHKIALNFENLEKPFPKKNIKRNLKRLGLKHF